MSGRDEENAQGRRHGPFPARWGVPPVEEAARFGWIRVNAFADGEESRRRRNAQLAMVRVRLLELRRRLWDGEG